jgi:hypothetical protein
MMLDNSVAIIREGGDALDVTTFSLRNGRNQDIDFKARRGKCPRNKKRGPFSAIELEFKFYKRVLTGR